MESFDTTLTESSRHLYVFPSVSWDAQIKHGHQLVNMGFDVWVHDHPYSLVCTLAVETTTPNGGCVRILLTPDDEGRKVVPVSKMETRKVPIDTYTDPPAGGR